MIDLTLVKGTSSSWVLQGGDRATGDAPTVFLATDAIAAVVWRGDDQASILAPAVAWVDAPTCQFRVSVADADTSSLDPGGYQLLVTVDRVGTGTVAVARTTFTILPAPGAATPSPVYCTAEDLRAECTWIDQVSDQAQDQSGFAQQRAEAREWFDGLILNGYPTSGYSTKYPGLLTWGRGSLLSDPWLVKILADDCLMLTGPRGRKAVRANVYYALAKVFRTKCEPGNKLAGYASEYARLANATAASLIVEIDVDHDGIGDLAVPLCVSRTRQG